MSVVIEDAYYSNSFETHYSIVLVAQFYIDPGEYGATYSDISQEFVYEETIVVNDQYGEEVNAHLEGIELEDGRHYLGRIVPHQRQIGPIVV